MIDYNIKIGDRLKMLPDYPSELDKSVTDGELENALIDGINSSVDEREERRLTQEEKATINDFFWSHFKKDKYE